MTNKNSYLVLTTVEGDEYVDKDVIARRLGISTRSVERLIEKNGKKLKKSKRRCGRKILYLWTDILMCFEQERVKKEHRPSKAIQRAYTKQCVQELKAENDRLRKEHESPVENILL